MREKALFDIPKPVFRRSNGRFATEEMAYADKQAHENARLRFEVEKYRRMSIKLAKVNAELLRKFNLIKNLINER